MYKLFLLLVAVGCVSAADDKVVYTRPRYHVDILKLNLKNDTLQHVCDGAIIGTRFVLTAAHCVYSLAGKELIVRSGSDVAPPPNMPYREERLFHRVLKVMYPMDYVHLPCRHHEHDIAVLKVNRAFDLAYDHLYKQVELPEASNDFEEYTAVVSGYSKGKLNTVDAVVISNEQCSRNSTSIVTIGNVCSLVSQEAAKNSEISGSPLVHDNTIIGIMNAPNKCVSDVKSSITCHEQSPQLKLYTRVTAYLDFINKILNKQASADIVYRS